MRNSRSIYDFKQGKELISYSWGARCVSSGPARLPACPSLSLDTNPNVRHANDTIRSPMYCQDRTGSTTWRVRRILLQNIIIRTVLN